MASVPASSLRQQAYDEIKRCILDQRYAPGAVLSENQLAEELQISRTPIREALRELATGGLVQILPQRGIIVSELSLQDIVEVYQLREELEGFATRLAAERIEDADRAGFQADHQRALAHMNAGRTRQGYDSSILLHDRIIRLARNSRLSQFMSLLSDQTHRFGLMTLRAGRGPVALREHGEIIAALLAGEADQAESLMRRHLRADRDLVMRLNLPAGTTGPELVS
jgi:DNA-binding GntR family transcriptional regulator